MTEVSLLGLIKRAMGLEPYTFQDLKYDPKTGEEIVTIVKVYPGLLRDREVVIKRIRTGAVLGPDGRVYHSDKGR